VTDIKTHLNSAFGDEPPLVDDLDVVMATGRGALRRHRGRTATFGVAGIAVLTAAVVVPIVASQGAGTPAHVGIAPAHHAPAGKQSCKSFYVAGASGSKGVLKKAKAQARSLPDGRVMPLRSYSGKKVVEVTNCTAAQLKKAEHADGGPTGPKYHYTEAPTAIAGRLATTLAADISAASLTTVYSEPFAQESSTLEGGHPSYYDGNVDVQVGSTLGDIGVQVNHPTTTQQPFDGKCDGSGFADCERTTLANGDVLQTDQLKVGKGGAFIIEAQVSRSDGTLVQAQESNYAFGPEATQAHGDQPLPLSALVTMAEDSAYSF
jgi:hypothetical protein